MTMPEKPSCTDIINRLRKIATKHTLVGMTRYGIPNDRAFGVSVKDLQIEARKIGRNHTLAMDLWKTGWYEARMLAVFLDEPERVLPSQMEKWCKDFDSWAICDTACFHLFDRTPHSFKKIAQWATRNEEFVRRAAFALLASVALHNKKLNDDVFLECIPLVETASCDERNFVKKGVSWALRGIGRRNRVLHQAASVIAHKLAAASEHPTERWIGKDVLRDITRPMVLKRIQGK